MRKPENLNLLKTTLKPGHVYRRADFVLLSSNVDRNLSRLVHEGFLKKVQEGLYLCPKKTPFGEALPDEQELLSKFLNDDHFVVYGPSLFNSLGLGTTQLYNRKVVFNRKRHGQLQVGGRTYFFHKWREAPKKLSKEFLLVEMMNRLDDLAENREQVLSNLKTKFSEFNLNKLRYALNHYGTTAAQKRLKPLFLGLA